MATTFYISRGKDTATMADLATFTVVSTSSASYNVLSTDYMIRCTSTGNQQMNLPTASGIQGRMYVFYKTQATGTLTIDAFSTETIDGLLFQTITAQYGTITVMSDGSNWMIV